MGLEGRRGSFLLAEHIQLAPEEWRERFLGLWGGRKCLCQSGAQQRNKRRRRRRRRRRREKRRRRGIAALCSIRTVSLLPPSLSYHIPTLIVFFYPGVRVQRRGQRVNAAASSSPGKWKEGEDKRVVRYRRCSLDLWAVCFGFFFLYSWFIISSWLTLNLPFYWCWICKTLHRVYTIFSACCSSKTESFINQIMWSGTKTSQRNNRFNFYSQKAPLRMENCKLSSQVVFSFSFSLFCRHLLRSRAGPEAWGSPGGGHSLGGPPEGRQSAGEKKQHLQGRGDVAGDTGMFLSRESCPLSSKVKPSFLSSTCL